MSSLSDSLTIGPVSNACPDNAFWNSTTGACETFTTGTPPPPLPSNVPWAWWQWLGLAAAIAGGGVVALKLYERHQDHKLLPDFFEHE